MNPILIDIDSNFLWRRVSGGGEEGSQCGGSIVGSKGGPGGVNQTLPLLTTGGTQAILGVQVLQKRLDELQNLENIDPNQTLQKKKEREGDHDPRTYARWQLQSAVRA
jgi:hypothetical protein